MYDSEKIKKELILPVDTDISLTSVILSKENESKISRFIEEHKNRLKLEKYQLYPMNKLLFYGDSGCGKTFLGKALTNYLGYQMLYVDISSTLSHGDIATNIVNVFKLANTGRYTIFLDECDSIAWNRDASNAERGDIRRATNSLFQCIDQLSSCAILICATNMKYRLDKAFERRFDLKLEFNQPKGGIKSIVKKFLYAPFNLVEDDIDVQVEESNGLSYDEIKCAVRRQMKSAVMRNTEVVKLSDIYADLRVVLNYSRVLKDAGN